MYISDIFVGIKLCEQDFGSQDATFRLRGSRVHLSAVWFITDSYLLTEDTSRSPTLDFLEHEARYKKKVTFSFQLITSKTVDKRE